MADRIVYVEKKRGGTLKSCGCLIVLALIVGYFFYSCRKAEERVSQEYARKEAAKTPEQRAAEKIAKLDPDLLDIFIADSVKKQLRDPGSYQKIATKEGDHPLGYAYIHEFRAKNGFGGYGKSTYGFLCATNTGECAWTMFTEEQLPELLKDMSVNGKKLLSDQ